MDRAHIGAQDMGEEIGPIKSVVRSGVAIVEAPRSEDEKKKTLKGSIGLNVDVEIKSVIDSFVALGRVLIGFDVADSPLSF